MLDPIKYRSDDDKVVSLPFPFQIKLFDNITINIGTDVVVLPLTPNECIFNAQVFVSIVCMLYSSLDMMVVTAHVVGVVLCYSPQLRVARDI